MAPVNFLAYIDPTGGLPPSVWGMILASIMATLGAVWATVRLFGRRILDWVKPRLAWICVIAALLLGCILGIHYARSGAMPIHRTTPRVLILGFDGLDPSYLDRSMGEGRLPNFSRLKKDGVFHSLTTTIPPQSPAAWASFITGSDPGHHGVFDFIKRDPKRYFPDLAISDRWKRACPWEGTPFWERNGITPLGMTALRLPLSFPPPKLPGRLLAGMGVWDVRGTEGTYFFYSTRPIQKPDARGMLFQFKRNGNRLTGQIPGPYRAGEDDNLREPFEVDLAANPATLRLQGQTYPLPDNRWSDWIRVEFRLGALKLQRVRAITRMILQKEGGEASLYISPLNFDPSAPLYPISFPTEYSAELCEAIGPYHTRGMPHDTQAVNDGVLSDDAFLDQCRTIQEESEKMLFHELSRFRQGALFGYFEISDVTQHMFWRTIDPESPLYRTEDSNAHRGVIPDCYRQLDDLIGRARAALGKEGTLVVMSDHGFAPFHKSIHLNSILRDRGFLQLKKGQSASPELFKNVDWSRTRAYALGFNAVYLNLIGREGKGIVSPEEAEQLARQIATELEAFTDPEGGQHPIRKAYAAADVYPGTSHPARPDLIIGYARGYRASWETALGSVPPRTIDVNQRKWSGDHCIDAQEVPGVFLSSDPKLDATALKDVGPAIDRYLGGARK
jgi:predicted AlkP superfamily phosphohydrolase/phosphomutase